MAFFAAATPPTSLSVYIVGLRNSEYRSTN
jgi:hypothetical protein